MTVKGLTRFSRREGWSVQRETLHVHPAEPRQVLQDPRRHLYSRRQGKLVHDVMLILPVNHDSPHL